MAGLLDSLDQTVTPHLTGQLAKLLGIEQAQVQEGLKIGGPLVLGELGNKASTPEGADKVLATLDSEHTDLLGNVMGAVTSGSGLTLEETLFGAAANKVAATIHDATGVDIAPLLPVVTPMVLGLLQNVVKSQKLDAAGLTALLKNENDAFAKTNPLLAQQIHAALEAGDQAAANAVSSRARFTDDEWATLIHAPALAGLAVMMSSLNGPIGITREIEALADTMGETAYDAPGDSLVALVSREFKTPEQLNALGANHQNAGQLATDACQAAVQILTAKATSQEQYEYKQLVMSAASRVAHASKEGGFLGIGGVEVNELEQTMLNQIADALGYKP